jgi:hypothetical protein
MHSKKIQFDLKILKQKNLLTIAESRFYLNLSRESFADLEANDPSFPSRKTATRHSRALLDVWLTENGSQYFLKSKTKILTARALRSRVMLDQIN